VNDPAGVSIDSLCRPSSSLQAITAGCTGSDGVALTDSSTACESCSSGFSLFMGGCYSQTGTPGSEICTAAKGGKCTACKTEGSYIFQNRAATVTLGNECILCSDATGDETTKGVANCNTCTAPSSAGPATCSACQAGYVRDQTNNECKKCGTGCSTCSASNQQGCTACLEGKYLDGNTCIDASSCTGAKYPDPKTNKCIQCNAAAEQGGIPECTACMYSDSLQKPVCSNCGNGGKLLRIDLDGTTSCVDDAGCTVGNTHIVDSTGTKKCLRCGDDANGGLAGCNTCSSKTTCTTCQDGYVKNSNGNTCDACGNNCATCTKANDMSTCSKCLPGYFLKTGSPNECVLCSDVDKGGIEGCAACTLSTSLTCNSCKPNYKASNTKPNPVTCTKACEDPTACGGTAGACDAIVVDGDGNMKHYCSYCGESTKFPIDGICNNVKGSNTCDRGVCTSCTTGYFLYMGGCYSSTSAPGNLMCKTAEGGICTTVANSRYFAVPGAAKTDQSVLGCGNPLGTMVGDSAYIGIQDCRTCTAPSAPSPAGMAAAKCTACDGGKTLTGSGYGCVMCSIAGCSACRADSMCEACSDGHRLEGEACVSTGPNLGTGAIAGISVAVIVVVGGLVGFLCWWFVCRGKA
ncbi:Variant-specific surface protein, partial [Giardia duodenalis]